MKRKKSLIIRITAVSVAVALSFTMLNFFHKSLKAFMIEAAVLSAKAYLPAEGFFKAEVGTPTVATTEKATIPSTQKSEELTAVSGQINSEKAEETNRDLTKTDEDIEKLIKKAEAASEKDKKDGNISEYKYVKDGVTDTYGKIRVKNVNETDIDIEAKLQESLDLSVDKDKPAVLIYHTHTTETYQLLDRDFYATGFQSRSSDKNRNMVRVGKAICEEIEKAGYSVIHVTDIHDDPYSGAYSRSRKTVEEYLKEYPSIQITLDIHRDAIQRSDGTKIAPTAEIDGKKAAQVMIISGCQEEGNGITNLPDWDYNLTFAVRLQQALEENFEGITRPLYFCPRSYNMNLTHCSLLVEVGSDGNTLDEAVYTGKCLGVAISEILKEYEQ